MPHLGGVLAYALLAWRHHGRVGIVAGIWAEKYDQWRHSRTSYFAVTFLSGVYSIHSVPPSGRPSRTPPVFYLMTAAAMPLSASPIPIPGSACWSPVPALWQYPRSHWHCSERLQTETLKRQTSHGYPDDIKGWITEKLPCDYMNWTATAAFPGGDRQSVLRWQRT